MRRRFSIIVLLVLLASMFVVSVESRPARKSSTIYIRADGGIEPPTAPIETFDNVTYTFTDNIYDSIVVERNNTVVDGSGFTLQGDRMGYGLTLQNVVNVTVRNVEVRTFWYGIWLESSSNNTVAGNNITNNSIGGVRPNYSSHNTVSGNNITNNGCAILTRFSSYNKIYGNNITNNYEGVSLYYSSNNTVSGNNITNNNVIGVFISYSSDNTVSDNNIANNGEGVSLTRSDYNRIYHNNIIDNTIQAHTANLANVWDDGCEGNYWNDYIGTDLDSDGIGDTPYIIDGTNTDNYPLMNPYWNPGDINHDLAVDIFDVVLVCVAYGSTPSDPNWNCHSDIKEPYGVIDILDIVLLAGSYGETYSP